MNQLWIRSLHFIRRVGGNERPILLLLLVVSVSGWCFAAIADEVGEGDTLSIDQRVLLSLREPGDAADPRGSRVVEEIARDITGLGGAAVLTGASLTACGYLALRGKFRIMIFVVVAVGGGIVISNLLKLGFDRPRPDLVPHGSHVYTASFPSGHAMMSAVTYLTLGALLSRVEARRTIRGYILAVATVTTLLVGVTRVYLGVHWPTDVLAGWSIGAAWAAACWTVANLLQRRGNLEGPAVA